MNKLILTAAFATAAIGVAGCSYDKDEYNDQAGYNAEESNYTDQAANYEAPATDSNMTVTNDMNPSDNAAGNEATTNTGSY